MSDADPITRLNAALEGRYRIERELGEGGMANVYLADDLKHERKVALKVLKPELAAVVGAERFLAEIKTTANLSHPHILPLFDSGEADGFLFYVMPHVEGETLRDRLDRDHQLPVNDAVQIAKNVAEALDYAHAQGVIHRDIKPANILLQAGKPVISDFGIALAVGTAGQGRLTETGLSMGTPHYMSPEQATGDLSVGAATDIYALGCVLYEMLVGEPPYTGSTAQAILGKIIAGKVASATEARASVPANVDAAIRKALEKVAADRFGRVNDFGKALADPGFRHGETAAAGSVVGGGPWKRLTMITTATTALFALAFVWSLLRPEPPQQIARFSSPFEEGQAPLRDMAFTADGSQLVYVGLGESGRQLWVRRWADLEATPIRGTEGVAFFTLSPDEREVAFNVGFPGPLRVVGLDGGQSRTLVEQVHSVGDWTPDGTVFFQRNDPRALSRVSSTGGAPEIVTELLEGETFHGNLAVLPGGQMGIFQVGHATNGAEIWAVDLDSGEREFLLLGSTPQYASTGHMLFGTPNGVLMAVPIDPSTAELTGPPVIVAEGLTVRGAYRELFYTISQGGALIYRAGGGRDSSRQLVVVDLAGNEEALVLAPRNFAEVGWSPDGQSVVYSSDGQIYTYDVVLNTAPRQLTFEGHNQNPVFSPDGMRVAFNSSRTGTDGYDLFVKNLDDDSPPEPIITLKGNLYMLQWPSDSLIVFERGHVSVDGDGLAPQGLWTVDLSDPENPRAEAYLSSEADLPFMEVSPDGTLAAYTSDESGQGEIYVRSFPVPGAQTIVSQGGGHIPFWSPDGSTIYYMTHLQRGGIQSEGIFTAARLERGPVPVVASRDILFSSAGLIRALPGSGLHPDGDRFVLVQTGRSTDGGDGVVVPARFILVQNFFEELKRLVPN